METIQEHPGQVHFYRVLESLARHNNVKPPNTLIIGYGFPAPVQMLYSAHKLQFRDCSKKPLEQAIKDLDMYPEGDEGYFPRYLLKFKGGKAFARSAHEVSGLLSHCRAEDMVVQPFLLPKGQKARSVRVTWRLSRGYRVHFYQNHLEMRERERRDMVTGPEAEVVEAQLSVRTNVLKETLDYVKLLVEKAIWSHVQSRLAHIQIQMMQDVSDNWFFLGIESMEAAQHLSPDPPFCSPLPSSKSARPPSNSIKQDIFPLPKSTSSTLKKPLICHSSRAASKPVFLYPEEYRKEQAVEEEVSKLLSIDSSRTLSNQTYKSWKKRVSEGPRMLFVDKMYAQAICKAKRTVQFETKATLRDLQHFKETIKAQTEEMLFKLEIQDRFAGKVAEQSEQMTSYSQTSKKKQRRMEQEYRTERTKEGIGRVVQDSVDKITAMTERIRAIKAAKSPESL